MWEFHIETECPHCGYETTRTATFHPDCFDNHGGKSHLMEEECWECDKKYWFETYLRFEHELEAIHKKKPHPKKKATRHEK